MRKLLLLPFLGFLAFAVNAQNSIPNGNFESWITGNFSLPESYPVSSNGGAFFRTSTPFNVTQATPAYHGAYAVQLSTTITNTDTVFGYFVNANPNGEPTQWHGGMPYSQKPTGMRGWFKYNLATSDSGSLLVVFSKAGINIGTYVFKLGGIHTAYTLFNFTFLPALTQTPDSMIFAALSCKYSASNQQPTAFGAGSLTLDSLSFTGVTSQPVAFNGDFENWVSKTIYKPESWYFQGDDQGDGLLRSTNAESGIYALELKTYAGSNNGTMMAQPGAVSTGHYDNKCNCTAGGYPFNKQVDTLSFSYIYVPSGNDSAVISLNFKNHGAFIGGNGITLHASSSYKHAEIPINLFDVPDSLIIYIQSSYYTDTAISNVGSDLKIDAMHFISQPLSGILKTPWTSNLSIYPNPTNGIINLLDKGFNVQSLEIYNIQGKKVYTKSNLNHQSINEIDISKLEKGIYYVKIYGSDQVHTEKIVIQ